MMFLLDTDVISELRRPQKANRNVKAWADAIPVTSFYLSAITILELEIGVLLLTRKDARAGAALRTWLEGQILPDFEGRILPVDNAVALRCASLHVPLPRPIHDSLIAATAMVHSMTLATRNRSDFEGTGVVLIDPWLQQTR
jgi:predicted nucleic acid-binding protein